MSSRVCVEHLNRCKTSTHYFNSRGGGSKGHGKDKNKKSDEKDITPSDSAPVKRRLEIPDVESNAAPIYGVQPIILSDDFMLPVTAIRARGLLMSGTRLKHLQQSVIVTVLLDACTVSALRAKNMHLRGEFAHFGSNIEDPAVYAEVVDLFNVMKLSNASSVRMETIGTVQTSTGDKLVTLGLPAIRPQQRGDESGDRVTAWLSPTKLHAVD